ncbi:MAG TPA: nucleotidyltransferase substrate binding protein [Flavipsychrobacter sp.]|nr:nucleotidyltransferase substrate binding protein [Flavipsychrobacter sp.]
MGEKDIRWQQRLANFKKAFFKLEQAVMLANECSLTELEQQGMIQAFEFTHELAWNVMRDYFRYQGNTEIHGSRDATREAFHKGLITDGDGWMEMIKSRNETSHTYNEETADEIADKIIKSYFMLFKNFIAKMEGLVK